MKPKTLFICLCAIILILGICLRYSSWRDNKYLIEEPIERVEGFDYNK